MRGGEHRNDRVMMSGEFVLEHDEYWADLIPVVAPNNGPTQPTQPTTPPKDWCQFYKTSINIDTDLMYLSGGGATWARISGKAVFADVLAPELAVVSLWAFTDRAISRYGGNWEHGCHN